MQVTIELLNDKALALLQQLEQLKVLRLVEPKEPPKKRKWSGTISKDTAEKLLLSVEKSRNEWTRDI
jgi:hypothetical protein